MTTDHTPLPVDALLPDPRFAEFLEWQLRSSLRRATRFSTSATTATPTSARSRFVRLALAAAALLVALTLGACGVLAVQEAERREEGQLLAAQYDVKLELARGREARAKEECGRREQQLRAGLLPKEEFDEAGSRLARLRFERQLLELDAAEVAARGREPDRRLGAERVGGRDFVDERLALEQAADRFESRLVLERYQRAELLQAQGLVPAAQFEEASVAMAAAIARQHSLVSRRETRRRFLAGDFSAFDAEWAGLRAIAEAERSTATALLTVATIQRDRLAALHQVDRIPAAELSAAEQALADAQARLDLAELELATIKARRREAK